MSSDEVTRRSVVRRSLATMSVGAVVGTAGCNAVTDRLDGGGGAPAGTETEAPEPAPERVYADWLPAPDVVDSDHYSFTYLDVDDLEANEDELDADSISPSSYEDFWEPLAVDWADASELTILGIGATFGFGGLVVTAEFDRDDAVSDLEEASFEADGEYEGYTVMVNDTSERAFAVGDEAFVLTSGEESVANAEAVIDANGGDVERYDAASDDMATLVGVLGSGSAVQGQTMAEPDQSDIDDGRFDNMVARGSQSQINGETTDFTWVVVYESEDDPDTDDLEAWVTANDDFDEQFDDVEDIGYDTSGRLGFVTGTMNTDDL